MRLGEEDWGYHLIKGLTTYDDGDNIYHMT